MAEASVPPTVSEETDPKFAAPPAASAPPVIIAEMETAVAGLVSHIKAWHLGEIEAGTVEVAETKAVEFINHLSIFIRGIMAKA